MKVSIIYRNIHIYRLIMNALYTFGYKQRFKDIINCIDLKHDNSVLDLCFGDIYVAELCKKNNITWIGYDINPYFTKYAKKKGFNASVVDISEIHELPKSDVCIISGSLYHFYPNAHELLKKMVNSSNKVLISEPVRNFSSKSGLIGKIAHIFSNAGKGEEIFRFNETSIIDFLDTYKKELHFSYIVQSIKRDIVIQITPN